jgi:hypothetical protein
VIDSNIITGAGAGMDFGAALIAHLPGRPLAELTTLVAEYAPKMIAYLSGEIKGSRLNSSAIASAGNYLSWIVCKYFTKNVIRSCAFFSMPSSSDTSVSETSAIKRNKLPQTGISGVPCTLGMLRPSI